MQFLAWPVALVGMAAIPYVKRLITETGIRPTDAERVLIFGSGWVGSTLVSRMLLIRSPPYAIPQGFRP